MYSSIIDKFGNIEKTQQNQARSCKTINTYTMTRKLTPTFKNIRQNCVRLTQIHCRIFPLNCVVLPYFFFGGGTSLKGGAQGGRDSQDFGPGEQIPMDLAPGGVISRGGGEGGGRNP